MAERSINKVLHERCGHFVDVNAYALVAAWEGVDEDRLREDLAIAARVRACRTTASTDHFGPKWVVVDEHMFSASGALLGWLLNGDQP